MATKTLDTIVQETLGLKEMVICRLQWQIDDLKAQLAEAQTARQSIPADSTHTWPRAQEKAC